MKKKIIIYSIFAVLLMVLVPNTSAINDGLISKSLNESEEQIETLDGSIFDILEIYIEMMFNFRMARVNLWQIFAEIPGMGGTILTLINFRAFLLIKRAEVSRDVLAKILEVIQQIMP